MTSSHKVYMPFTSHIPDEQGIKKNSFTAVVPNSLQIGTEMTFIESIKYKVCKNF